MKRLILIATVLITSVVAFAQSDAGTFSIQPKVGINIAYYGESQAAMGNIGTSPRIGLAAGVELAYQVREKIGLSVGVIYSQQSEKTETPTNWYSSVRMTAKTDYINFPILVNIYIYKGLALKFGVQPGINVKSGYSVDSGAGKSGQLSDLGINIRKFDLCIPLGLSYEFRSIVLDARYNLGVTNIVHDSGDDMTWNRGAQITIGYKFNL